MKKTIVLFILIIGLLALAGCSGNSPANSQVAEPPASSAQPPSVPEAPAVPPSTLATEPGNQAEASQQETLSPEPPSIPPIPSLNPSSPAAEPGKQAEAPKQETPALPPNLSLPAESGTHEKPSDVKQDVPTSEDTMPTVTIQAAGKSFTATLYDNESARAFVAKLPLTLSMDELNGNEKFYFFSERFPTNSEPVGNIKAGDLMLYGSDCLVLFYESFPTSYSYTKLGYVDDVNGLASALGNGSVRVTFNALHSGGPNSSIH